MSEYRMDINGDIELGDYSSIYDYISIVNKNDNLTISIDNDETQNIDIVCKMLETSHFIINLNERKNDGKYYIKAHKNNR
ncbi:hypothetical protein JMF89_14645 [Clostridiaceae bacterium UIB06]|nr:hypothetical protein [Clostridiaceae bacterium UIB06]